MLGEERADLRAGIISQTVANAFRGKNRRVFKPSDFMPYLDDGQAETKDVSRQIREAFKKMGKGN